MTQPALLCGCGSDEIVRGDTCRVCDRRARLSKERFAGLREAALRRDGYQCQCCGAFDSVLVHHRMPRWNFLRSLITLCRGCHVLVHHLRRPAFAVDGLLLVLWLEVNRGPVQVRFRFHVEDAAPQLELFETVSGIWSVTGAARVRPAAPAEIAVLAAPARAAAV